MSGSTPSPAGSRRPGKELATYSREAAGSFSAAINWLSCTNRPPVGHRMAPEATTPNATAAPASVEQTCGPLASGAILSDPRGA
jgi:hypothetical protein